jgi:hypothetical protein
VAIDLYEASTNALATELGQVGLTALSSSQALG